MASTEFTALVTFIRAVWLNEVDAIVHDVFSGATTVAEAKIALSLVIGTDVQAYDAVLTAISALGTAADKMLYTTGPSVWAETTITAAARSILDDSSVGAMLTTLGAYSKAEVDALIDDLSGVTNASGARTNLGLGALALLATINNAQWSGTDLAIGNGGTGVSTAQAAIDILSAVSAATNEFVLTKDTGTGNAKWKIQTVADGSITPAKLTQPFTSGTKIDTTSGTSHDYTGIPSWVKKITVQFYKVSTNGVSPLLIQIGDAGGIEVTNYLSQAQDTAATSNRSLIGFAQTIAIGAAGLHSGEVILTLTDSASFSWVSIGIIDTNVTNLNISGGSKSLSATLDRVRLTTINGTDTFDAGKINILYE